MNTLKDLKQKVRTEVQPKPWKQQLSGILAMVIFVATLFIAVKFGVVAGIVFGFVGLGFSIFAGRKWNI